MSCPVHLPTAIRLRLRSLEKLAALVAVLAAGGSVVAQTTTETQLLTGTSKDDPVTWDFFCTAGRNSGTWTTIGVPSCWELQGFGTYNYGNEALSTQSSEQGLYRRTFTVPSTWTGRTVQLVFEGSMTDTSVKINGTSAGAMHQGAFTQFRYDVTSLLNYGASNLIEVTVAKKSSNASVNDAERTADFWIFGGIFRPVYLESRPAESIQRIALDAKASGAFTVQAALNGISTADNLTGRILTLDGQAVGAAFSTALSNHPATATLSTTASGITPWNPEKPSLYQLVLELRHGTDVVHTITQRFGFRTVEVRTGDGIYLNGVKIRLKGVNRHTFTPETGRTSSPALAAEAIALIRGLNMNAVRMSHYPPDQYFLDQCDEAGLMVLDEVPGWQGAYDDTVAPRMVQEVVVRDVNHPSIIFWDNGNEGGWNTTVDTSFATYDPQKRTVLHPGGTTFGGINAAHYPTYAVLQSTLGGGNLVMPTEFLHGLYDGGAGAGLQDYWNLMVSSPKSAGGFIWSFADEGVVRVDQGGAIDTYGNNAPDGIVGPHNEKEPSYDTVRDLWSPAVVTASPALTSSFNGQIALRNDYFFTSLSACTFKWEVLDFPRLNDTATGATVTGSATLAGPAVAPQQSGTLQINLPAGWAAHDALRLTAMDREGRFLRAWTWPIQSQAAMAAANVPAPTGTASSVDNGASLILSGGGIQVAIGKTTGLISSVSANGSPLSLSNGPRLVSGTATLVSTTASQSGNDRIVTANFSGNLQSITYRMRGDGWMKIDYQFSLSGNQTSIGMTFDYPPAKVTGLRWLGDGPQPVWKNRLAGPSLAVWSKTANDAVPGYRWTTDPVFRGYHSGLRWMVLQTSEKPIEIVSETPNLFLRVLSPSNGTNPANAIFTMPAGDLSLLQAIAPIGNKFHSAGDVGPMSSPNTAATGTYSGSFWLHFGGEVSAPVAPTIKKVEASETGRVTVTYDHLMSADAQMTGNYAFVPPRTVHAVTSAPGNSVVLDIQPLVEGSTYQLKVKPVTSIDNLPLTGATDFPISFNSGLQVRLPFDAANGGASADTSGHGSNATLSNAVLSKGYAASAATFSGTAGSSGSVILPSLTQMTIAAWVRPMSAGNSNFPRIVSFVGDAVQFLLDFSGGTPEKIGFQVAGKGSWRGSGTPLPALGTWTHIAVTYDAGSTEPPNFYLNGLPLSAVNAAGANGTFDTAGVATIGNRASDGLRGFDGSIDQLLLYNRVLSPAEIKGLAVLPATRTFAQWRAAFGLPDGGPGSDADHDGTPDLIEYLAASDPTQSSPPPTSLGVDSGNEKFFFPVAQDAEGVDVVVETSTTLGTEDWTALPASEVSLWRVSGGVSQYLATVPDDGHTRFFRLRLNVH